MARVPKVTDKLPDRGPRRPPFACIVPRRIRYPPGDALHPVPSPTVTSLPVYVPHIERGPHQGILAEVARQGFEPIPRLTPVADPYSYSSLIRELWREGTGFIIVEQDARPPDNALRRYTQCEHLVCNRPHNCRRLGVMGSLACVKFSRELVTTYPDMADRILARPRPLEWWRHGFWLNRPYQPGAAVLGGLSNAVVDPAVVERLGPWPNPNWPTTQEWPHSDTVIFEELARLGIETHYHTEPSVCFPDPDEHFPNLAV